MDELYNKVFEKLSGDMLDDANVDDLRLLCAGTCELSSLSKLPNIELCNFFLLYSLISYFSLQLVITCFISVSQRHRSASQS